MESPGTVFGVPLEPGERVVYFHRDEPGWQKPFLIVLGVLTLVAIIGLFFLAAGLMADTTVFIITTRRFLIINGKKVSQLRHGAVKEARLRVKGNRPQWYTLYGHDDTQLAYQLGIDAPAMQRAVKAALDAPAELANRPEVPFDAERPTKKS
jgi:hypothetical protein